MKVNCRSDQDIWPVTILPLKIEKGIYYEVRVSARGSDFHVIVGTHEYGRYLCIPNWNVGCELAELNDRFWNERQIQRYVGEVDAASIACGICHLEELENELL